MSVALRGVGVTRSAHRPDEDVTHLSIGHEQTPVVGMAGPGGRGARRPKRLGRSAELPAQELTRGACATNEFGTVSDRHYALFGSVTDVQVDCHFLRTASTAPPRGVDDRAGRNALRPGSAGPRWALDCVP